MYLYEKISSNTRSESEVYDDSFNLVPSLRSCRNTLDLVFINLAFALWIQIYYFRSFLCFFLYQHSNTFLYCTQGVVRQDSCEKDPSPFVELGLRLRVQNFFCTWTRTSSPFLARNIESNPLRKKRGNFHEIAGKSIENLFAVSQITVANFS